MLARNQIGDLTLPPFGVLDPQLVASDLVMPGDLDAFGPGFKLNRKPLASGRGANTMSSAGIFNTFFWVDREKGVCAVRLVQMLPFGDPEPTRLVEDFDRAVYRVFR